MDCRFWSISHFFTLFASIPAVFLLYTLLWIGPFVSFPATLPKQPWNILFLFLLTFFLPLLWQRHAITPMETALSMTNLCHVLPSMARWACAVMRRINASQMVFASTPAALESPTPRSYIGAIRAPIQTGQIRDVWTDVPYVHADLSFSTRLGKTLYMYIQIWYFNIQANHLFPHVEQNRRPRHREHAHDSLQRLGLLRDLVLRQRHILLWHW